MKLKPAVINYCDGQGNCLCKRLEVQEVLCDTQQMFCLFD